MCAPADDVTSPPADDVTEPRLDLGAPRYYSHGFVELGTTQADAVCASINSNQLKLQLYSTSPGRPVVSNAEGLTRVLALTFRPDIGRAHWMSTSDSIAIPFYWETGTSTTQQPWAARLVFTRLRGGPHTLHVTAATLAVPDPNLACHGTAHWPACDTY